MPKILIFLSTVGFINGIPHFVNGVSGRVFVEPGFYSFFRFLSNQTFNTLWGLLNFLISFTLYAVYRRIAGEDIQIGFNLDTAIIVATIIVTSVGLSKILTKKLKQEASRQ